MIRPLSSISTEDVVFGQFIKMRYKISILQRLAHQDTYDHKNITSDRKFNCGKPQYVKP